MPKLDAFALGDAVIVDGTPTLKGEVCGYGIAQYDYGVQNVLLVQLEGGSGVPLALRPERLTNQTKRKQEQEAKQSK